MGSTWETAGPDPSPLWAAASTLALRERSLSSLGTKGLHPGPECLPGPRYWVDTGDKRRVMA